MNRKSGGLIGKKVVITPTDGSPDASASGIWTLQDVADYEAAGTFPQPDVPPIATEIAANVTMQATETQDLAVTFSGASDPDGDTIFDWTITESSGSLSLTPSSFTNVSSATTTFTAGEVSADTPITVTVTVTDQYGLSASKNFTFTIINDTSPVADGGTIAVASLEEGAAYSVDCKNNFTDDNGDGNLTFSLASGTLPVGASLNTSTGVISDSAINVVSGNTGTVTYSYSITATDSPKGQTATQAYSSPVTKQPINAVWSSWGSWGSCSVSCGGGTQSSSRTCTEQLYGGTTCANTDGGNSSRSQACNTQSCATILSITSSTNNYDISSVVSNQNLDVILTINSGVTVGSTSTSVPAMKTGTGWGSGTTITIINNGSIIGKSGTNTTGTGGSGGNGGGYNQNGSGGGAGSGSAESANNGGNGFEHSQTADSNLLVDFTTNGTRTGGSAGYRTFKGGGGGGGGGGVGHYDGITWGGCGGGGARYGSRGSYLCGGGSNGGATSGGSGGGGQSYAGSGGAGGNLQSNGGNGGQGYNGWSGGTYGAGKAGGSAGSTNNVNGSAGSALSGNTGRIT